MDGREGAREGSVSDDEGEQDRAMDALTAVVDEGVYFDAEDDSERIASVSSSSTIGKRRRSEDESPEATEEGGEAAETSPPTGALKEADPLPYSYDLMKFCFLTLQRYETPNLATLNLQSFRNDVATHLPRENSVDIFNISDQILLKVIDDYLITVQQKEKRSITPSILKYSKRETEIILGAVRAYMKEYSLSLEDVCPSLRPDSDHLKGAKKDLIRRLFDELHMMLPYRQRDTIKFFVERKLFLSIEPLRGRWTDEEKERLLSLYDKYGPKWAKLGRELHKRHEDVR